MSRVNSTTNKVAAPAVVEMASEPPAEVPASSVFSESEGQTSLTAVHTKTLVVDHVVSATELNLGKEVALSANLPEVFADGVDGVTGANTKVVISGIDLQNVYSDCPARVAVSANLFETAEQKTGLVNEAGWLYSQQSSELAAEASDHVSYAKDGNFVNLCSLLPFETARHASCPIYTPTNSSLNQRHLMDYGGISSKDELWKGIVAVTDTTYYVPASSVVCKVISKNWDRFGFHPQQEQQVEGNFYRIDKPIVQSVVDQLYSNVIAKLPFTSLDKLKLHLQSNVAPSNSTTHKVSMQLKVSYRYPTAMAEE